MSAQIADRRLYLDAAKERVVEDGDPSAAYLFATEGSEIGEADMGRYGLSVEDGKVALPKADEPEEDQPTTSPPKRKGAKK